MQMRKALKRKKNQILRIKILNLNKIIFNYKNIEEILQKNYFDLIFLIKYSKI